LSQGFTSVGARRATAGIVPGRVAAVAELRAAAVPRPQFDQGMQPEIQAVHGEVRPDVANLMLSGSPHFLQIVEVLFDGGTIGEGFENRDDALLGIGSEEGAPAMRFLDQHDPNHTAGGAIGYQERFVGLGGQAAVQHALDGFPSTPLTGLFEETEFVFAIHTWPAARATLTRFEFRWQVAQGRVFAQATDHDQLGDLQHTPQKRPLGVAAVDHDPHGSARSFEDWSQPLDQSSCQLQLGGEPRPTAFLGDRGQRLLANVEHRPQGQL